MIKTLTIASLLVLSVQSIAQTNPVDDTRPYLHKDEFIGTMERNMYVVQTACSFGSFEVNKNNFVGLHLDENPYYGSQLTHTGTLKLQNASYTIENARLCNALIFDKKKVLVEKTRITAQNVEAIKKVIEQRDQNFSSRIENANQAIEVTQAKFDQVETNRVTQIEALEGEREKNATQIQNKYGIEEEVLKGKSPLQQIAELEAVIQRNNVKVTDELVNLISVYNLYNNKIDNVETSSTEQKKAYLTQISKLKTLVNDIEKERVNNLVPLNDQLVKTLMSLTEYNKALEKAMVSAVDYADLGNIPVECSFQFKDQPAINNTGIVFETTTENDVCRCDVFQPTNSHAFGCYRVLGATNVKEKAEQIEAKAKAQQMNIRVIRKKYAVQELKGPGESR